MEFPIINQLLSRKKELSEYLSMYIDQFIISELIFKQFYLFGKFSNCLLST